MATRAVPANKKSINQDRFTWTVPGTRKRIDVPAVSTLTLRQVRDMQHRKETTIDDVLDIADTDASRELLLDLEIGQLKGFVQAWATAGDPNLGKS
jgi:hypothetical protein